MTYPAVKGTRDFYPDAMSARSAMFTRLKNVAMRYGFSEVNSPALETLKLLTAKSGEEIKQQIFVTEKRSSEEIGMRFDMTVPLARMFIEKQKELPKPVKWYYATNMWRYEAPQRGRLREFYQFGVEMFGPATITADAEIISLAIDCLQELGLTKDDVVLKVNSRQLVESFVSDLGITDIDKVFRVIDKKPKISADAFQKEIEFLSEKQRDALCAFL
ncbi:MAG: ATP phosphoribosyltransferase regulatory subunit, partial [Candidatus Woesearchaeota archaeon]